MSTSASISLSKYQINNVKQAITDLKSENTEYINTMKRLIDSTHDIHRDNKKLEQGIELQRNYLLRLKEKIAKGSKSIEKKRLLNIQATHRMKKYQRQISKQTRGVSILKIRDEIDRLLNEITKIKQKTSKYKQKVDDEQSTIEQINKLNELKHDLVKMNQCLTQAAQKLITGISQLKMPSEIEKHVNELKQKMLKSEEIRKKLEEEDPNFQYSNSDIFAQVDDRLKQAVPIFDDLESLFLSSSSVVQTFNKSSDPISVICSELALSEISKVSQKSSSRTENDILSSKMSQNNLDSSSSLSLNEQKGNKTNPEFAKTMNNLLNKYKSEDQLNDENKKAESENPIKSKYKDSNLSSSIIKNKKHKSKKSRINSEVEESESKSKIDQSDSDQEKQKSKQEPDSENEESENENQNNEYKNKESKSKKKKLKHEEPSSKSKSTKLDSKTQKFNSNTEIEESESENQNENNKNNESKSKKMTLKHEEPSSKSKSTKLDSKTQKFNSNPEIEESESENQNENNKNNESKSKRMKLKHEEPSSKSKSTKLDLKTQRSNSNPENEESESENQNENIKNKESKPKRKKSRSKSIDSVSENQINSDAEPKFTKSKKAKSINKRINSDNQETDNENPTNQENENENKNKKQKSKNVNDESVSKNKKSKSEDEESKSKKSKKLASYNKFDNLSVKSADESLYPTSSSQEIFLSDSKQNKSESLTLSQQSKDSTKPKKIKKRKTSKQPELNKTLSYIHKDDDNDDIVDINSKSNLLAKTQPGINKLLTKKQSNKIESDSNINPNDQKRKRKRKSSLKINNSLSEYSSPVLPDSTNKNESKNSNDLSKSKSVNNDSDYSDSFSFDKNELNNKKSTTSKNDKSKDITINKNDQNITANTNNALDLINPIANKLISTDKNKNDESKNDESKNDDFVFKRRKVTKQNQTQKKEIDSDSDSYEPCLPKHNKSNKQENDKKVHKQRKNNKSSNSSNAENDDNAMKSVYNKMVNENLLNKDENNSSSAEAYNDGYETDDKNNSIQQNKGNNNIFSIFGSNGKPIIGSIFVNKNGVPLKNTKAFDKEGNPISKSLKFNENGTVQEDEDIFDIFKNKINSIIQINDKGEPTNIKIFDSQGNEIKDVFKIMSNSESKKKEKIEIDSNKNNLNNEIIEEEEEYSDDSSKSKPNLSKSNQNILNIFDKKQNKITNPVLIDSKNGKPINTQLFDSKNDLLNDPIETHSNGKPKNKVYDSNGNEINCLISVDENGVPIKPKIYDEEGNQIKSLKPFINENKKKIKIRKTHRLFDKDNQEIKNILIIDSTGKPLNISVFDSKGKEIKSSIRSTQSLFDSNNTKIDAIVEIDSSGHPTNSKIFDSKGNEFNDLNFLLSNEKDQIESSASLSENEEYVQPKKPKKPITITIDEDNKPINSKLYDSDGNEITVVEFDQSGSPTKHIYNKNKKKVTKIIIRDQDEYEEDIDSISSLSSSSESTEIDDQIQRSKSELDNIFCDANGNEFKNPIFVDLQNKPYNNVKVYDSQCHVLTLPIKYDPETGTPQNQIFDYQGLPYSHVVQIGPDGNPTNFTLYNIQMEPVTFPTLKIQKPKREKLQMVDDKENPNIISFEKTDKEEEDSKDKKPKKSSQTKWTRPILSSIISSQLDKTKLSVSVVDANVTLIHLEEEIHNLEEETLFLERKVNSQIELRDKVEKAQNMNLTFNTFDFFIEPTPEPDRSEYLRDVYIQSEMTEEHLNQIMNEIDANSKYLADNIVFEQQKKTADFHFPELEKIYYKLMSKNSKLKHVIDKLESHLNIVTSESMAEYASKETRMRVRFEDSKKERMSTMSQAESSISDGSIQINDLNNKIEDQKVLIKMLNKQIAEQQRKERPDAKKLCLELDGLRGIEKKNHENLKMLELEQNSIETQASKIYELIDEKSMSNLQQSIDDYQRQLNDIKDSFARMRKKTVKKANPLTNKYELMGLDERIKEAKKQIADVKRKDSVAVNKIDKRIKILQSYGLRVPSHKRVSNGECV